MDIPVVTTSLTGDRRAVRCLHILNTSTKTAASSSANTVMRPMATIGETAATICAWIINDSRRSKKDTAAKMATRNRNRATLFGGDDRLAIQGTRAVTIRHRRVHDIASCARDC